MADRIGRMIESGVAESESMALVTNRVGQRAETTAGGKPMPPLLAWALSSDVDDQSRPAVLRMVADTYRRAAIRQGRIWRTFASGLIGVLVGGFLVLGYATTVFLAMTELLRDVALRGGS